jgi:hypothetical protein
MCFLRYPFFIKGYYLLKQTSLIKGCKEIIATLILIASAFFEKYVKCTKQLQRRQLRRRAWVGFLI